MAVSRPKRSTKHEARSTRHDGRRGDELRPVSFERDYLPHLAGSVLVSFGRTRVLCTVCVGVGTGISEGWGQGWLTSEYGCCGLDGPA